jgi:hypothetical protein
MSNLAQLGSCLEGRYGEYEGLRVLVVLDGARVVGVSVDSVEHVLEPSMTIELRGEIHRARRQEWVDLDGVRIMVRILTPGQMALVCVKAGLKSVSDKIERIVDSIQNTGGYIAPNAGAEAYLDDETRDDKDSQMLASLLRQRKSIIRHEREIQQHGQRLEVVEKALGVEEAFATVVTWFSSQGVKATEDDRRIAGMKLRAICDKTGWQSKVAPRPHGQYPVQMWPIAAWEVYWRQWCQDKGIHYFNKWES